MESQSTKDVENASEIKFKDDSALKQKILLRRDYFNLSMNTFRALYYSFPAVFTVFSLLMVFSFQSKTLICCGLSSPDLGYFFLGILLVHSLIFSLIWLIHVEFSFIARKTFNALPVFQYRTIICIVVLCTPAYVLDIYSITYLDPSENIYTGMILLCIQIPYAQILCSSCYLAFLTYKFRKGKRGNMNGNPAISHSKDIWKQKLI